MATQTAQFARISLALSSPTARLVLNNPPLNVIDIPMMEELAQALSGIETRSEISEIVISGAGKNLASEGLRVHNRPAMTSATLDTNRKVQRINLDANRYGTFAEIGAGLANGLRDVIADGLEAGLFRFGFRHQSAGDFGSLGVLGGAVEHCRIQF